MIRTEEKTFKQTVSFAVCGECGQEGPHAVDPHDAHELAIDEGWKHKTIYPGGEATEIYKCSECNMLSEAIEQEE